MGFRRRTRTANKISTGDGHAHSKRASIAKSLSREKKSKKKCSVMAEAVGQRPSIPPRKDAPPQMYQLTFKQVLQAYKTLHKGSGFHSSKKVLKKEQTPFGLWRQKAVQVWEIWELSKERKGA